MPFLLVVAILILSALALLAVPVTLAFRIERVGAPEGQLRLRWLFGLVRYRVAFPGPEGESPRRRGREKEKTGRRRRRLPGAPARRLLSHSAFMGRAVPFAGDLLRAANPRDLRLRLRIGLDDPADTGRLWAVLGPLSGLFAGFPGAEVRLEPGFMDPALEVEGSGELRLVPLRFVALAVAFAASPATLRALAALRRG